MNLMKIIQRCLAHVCCEKEWSCAKWFNCWPYNCKPLAVLIQAAPNQKQTNRRGLTKLLKLKIGARVKLTANLGMQDRLING